MAINTGHIFRYIKKPWSETEFVSDIRKGLTYYKYNTRLPAAVSLDQNMGHITNSAEQERLNGVLEMATSVCHEFAQPLQVISGYSDLLTEIPGVIDHKKMAEKYISRIQAEIKKLGDLLIKVMTIKHYKTKPYSSNRRMVDIDNASSSEVSPFLRE